jgi:hypothetical protein
MVAVVAGTLLACTLLLGVLLNGCTALLRRL